jgi:hypothetical protein
MKREYRWEDLPQGGEIKVVVVDALVGKLGRRVKCYETLRRIDW